MKKNVKSEKESPLETRAYQLLDAGRADEALALAERILAGDPRSARAHHVRGLALARQEQVPAALAALDKACRLGRGIWEAHADRVDVLLHDADDPDAALAACEAALAKRPETGLKAELLRLRGQTLLALGRPAEALATYEAARRLGPDHDDPQGRGTALFELCRFKEAIAALRTSLRHGQGLDAEGHFILGAALERVGEAEAAHRHFVAASRQEPDRYAVPRAMPAGDFEALVAEALEDLPEQVGSALADVQVVVQAWPEPEELSGADPPLSPLLFGMFRGHSLRDRSHANPWSLLPPQIAIYQRNLELQCASREEMVEEIRITVWHEVGHFLGLDEEELDDRGLS